MIQATFEIDDRIDPESLERCPIGERRREKQRTGFVRLKDLHTERWIEVGASHHRTGRG
jgi:hypothetical protein